MARDDFRDGRPRAARRTVAVIPGFERGQQAIVGWMREQHALKQMNERADRELGHEPHQIGCEAAVRRAGADGGLIARQRSGEERAWFDLSAPDRVADARGGVAGAADRERLAILQQHWRQNRYGQRNRLSAEDRYAARELGGQILRRQRQPGKTAGVERVLEVDDERQKRPLEVEGGREIRSRGADGGPPSLRRLEQIAPISSRNRQIRHRLVIMVA